MKTPLSRFGVALETPLLEELDVLAEERGCTRSALLGTLARAEVTRAKASRGVPAIATLTIVYDHHVRDLTERLTELQHELGEDVRASLHVHLSHDLCLEVIVMRGRSDRIRSVADQILNTRGVRHGGVEIIVDRALSTKHGKKNAQHRHG